MTLVLHCKADCPLPPVRLKYEWLDPFTVNVSWEKPDGLQDKEIKFKYCLVKNGDDQDVTGIKSRNFTYTCLTEETDNGNWTFNVWTDGSHSCNGSSENTRAPITFSNHKLKAKLVKDFKCVIYGNETDCSWVPVDPSLNLMLSYRICGLDEERLKGLKKCNRFYSKETRTGCRVKLDAKKGDICILVETETSMSTFKAELAVLSPKLTVREERNKLILSWKQPEIGKQCVWKYEVCHTQCSNPKVCNNYPMTGEPLVEMTYDKSCRYEIQSRVWTDYCKKISSDFSEVVTYGTDNSSDRTLTLVAIILPAILSVCVLLSCYCFRRHSAIICPNIPDPSAIFKEMMMNGSKERKTTTGSLYTPVPETVDPCKISPVTENSSFQENV
ncbi:interleukin-13 receptor subunit alpha-1-like [Xyrichtys novacula]|uniref:Interleukin-13 receptor subunit alpha-1-like n=1 Tax=Xyrichtys novacula TaxID=13765 RepID=A0AAV1HKQ1_XYRNO|nr:interleukin-13 receptor subunit alpha-1-like [Xyrichtys novacula]